MTADKYDAVPCEGALTCERVHSGSGHLGWHSRLMPNGTFVEWTDDGRIRVTEDTGEEEEEEDAQRQ